MSQFKMPTQQRHCSDEHKHRLIITNEQLLHHSGECGCIVLWPNWKVRRL